MLLNYNLFFFNDTATTEIYTLSLHDALPIWFQWRQPPRRCGPSSAMPHTNNGVRRVSRRPSRARGSSSTRRFQQGRLGDRKSTRLNSSHGYISYAVFFFKKKKIYNTDVHYCC